jgi:hypothetical protein
MSRLSSHLLKACFMIDLNMTGLSSHTLDYVHLKVVHTQISVSIKIK